MQNGTFYSSIVSSALNPDSDARAFDAACEQAGMAATTLASASAGAYAAGAGALTGYAGMASTVSSLGLGSITTTAAGMLGSSASGAAATAVVTSALGGVKQHRKLTPHRRPILTPSGRDCLCPTNGCARARSGME